MNDKNPGSDLSRLSDDAAVEAWLLEARLDPVPDEGFTAAVMQRLPAHRGLGLARLAPLWGAALGGGLLAWQLVSTQLLNLALTGAPTGTLLGPRVVLMLALLGLGALAASWLWSERAS